MINDEELILYYYRDGLPDERIAQIDAALERDPDLAERFTALHIRLGALGRDDEPKASPQAMRRWHASLDQVASVQPKRQAAGLAWLLQPFQFGAGLATAAALVLGLGIVIGLNLTDKPTGPGPSEMPPGVSSNSFAAGLRLFLEETEVQLAGLDSSDAGMRQALVTEIIGRNRMYELAAESSNDPELARVLRAFEVVLTGLADEQISPDEIQAAQAQLAFELSVMQTKLAHAASKPVQKL